MQKTKIGMKMSNSDISKKHEHYQESSGSAWVSVVTTKVTNIIVSLLAYGMEQVAMQHLYRKSFMVHIRKMRNYLSQLKCLNALN